MNVLSLFDGISVGKVALEMLGIKVENYFASEIDENAMAISKSNHDDVIYLGDVTNWRTWDLPKIDLVIGGSPCQGFSRNGQGLNFSDPRSKLFFDFVDIVNHIKLTNNPNVYFMLENVSMKMEWRDLISEYMGVDYLEIDSKIITAQNRPRLYWTNIPNVTVPEPKDVKLLDILEDIELTDFYYHEGLKFDSKIYENESSIVSVVDGEVRIKQATKLGYIVPNHGDGINFAIPHSKHRRGRAIRGKSPCLDTYCNCCVYLDGTFRKFTLTELERLQTLPDGYTQKAGLNERKCKKAIGNGWTAEVIAHIFKPLTEVFGK